MTAENPTPEEWTRWQLDKLRICTANRARLMAAKDELQKNIRSMEDVRDHSSQFGIRFALDKAMRDVREAMKHIDGRIQDCEGQMDAYEDIIARRDMSKTAYFDALCRIIKEREADESQ